MSLLCPPVTRLVISPRQSAGSLLLANKPQCSLIIVRSYVLFFTPYVFLALLGLASVLDVLPSSFVRVVFLIVHDVLEPVEGFRRSRV